MQKITLLIIALFIFFSNALFAQHLKKDGTPDRRYKENKSYSAPSNYSSSTTHLKKDGTPDRRYKENKSYSAPSNYSSSTTHLKKDGTPDKRYKDNRTYFSTPSTSTSPSFKYYTSTKKNKTLYYYSVKSDANGKIHRSQSATYAFKRMTGYPHGRPGYVIDHIIALKRGGCDCPSNMQWQTVNDAKAKDKIEVP